MRIGSGYRSPESSVPLLRFLKLLLKSDMQRCVSGPTLKIQGARMQTVLTLTCRRCGSTDVMRVPRRKWEQALPLAAYCCRNCGKRFRAQRPPEDDHAGQKRLVDPRRETRARHTPLDRAIASVLVRVTHSPAPSRLNADGVERRIDRLLSKASRAVRTSVSSIPPLNSTVRIG